MSISEQAALFRDALKQQLGAAASRDVKSLAVRKGARSTISFEEAIPYLERCQAILRRLDAVPIGEMSGALAQSLVELARTFNEICSKIQSFDPAKANAVAESSTLIAEAMNYENRLQTEAHPAYAYVAFQRTHHPPDAGPVEKLAKSFESRIDAQIKAATEATAAAKKLVEDLQAMRADAAVALGSIRERAGLAGVAENAEFFHIESSRHSQSAYRWLLVICGLVLVFAYLLYDLSTFTATQTQGKEGAAGLVERDPSVAVVLSRSLNRLVVLSVISLVFLWVGRNYRSHKHNETLNTHRQNALATFKTFYQSSPDPSVRDAILLQAAHAAFSQRPTGFDGPEKEQVSVPQAFELASKAVAAKS